MKSKINILENDVETIKIAVNSHNTRTTVLESKVLSLEHESDLHRKAKHETNKILQNQNGKIEIIGSQQTSTTEAIEKLTKIVEGALDKVGKLMNLKSMMIGASWAFTGTIITIYYAVQLYVEYKK